MGSNITVQTYIATIATIYHESISCLMRSSKIRHSLQVVWPIIVKKLAHIKSTITSRDGTIGLLSHLLHDTSSYEC